MRASPLIPILALVLASGCSSSDTDLSEAIAQGDHQRVQELVEDDVDLDSPLVLGMTPLMSAANRDSSDIVALLIDSGADVNTRGGDGLTPIHIAARADSVESARLLLEAGADPMRRSVSGMNALEHAADNGSSDFIAWLVTATEMDLDQPSQSITQGHGYPRDSGPTPLGLAVRGGHTEAIATLLDLGADVDARTASGHTPLLLAVYFNQSPEVVRILVAAGADVTAEARCDRGCSVGGREPLTVAEWAEELDREELVSVLHPGNSG